MSRSAKIVFIGAGSASFGLGLLRDLVFEAVFGDSLLTLVDPNPAKAERMRRLGLLLAERAGSRLRVEVEPDLDAALDGADFVVNAAAVERNRLWKLDFEVPRKHGIRHTLGENGGPGGLFFTLRTLPMVFDLARRMERRCPGAVLINYANPENRIIAALGKYSSIRVLGLCHGVFMGRDDVARVLALPSEQVDVWAAGVNHFQWLLQIRRRDGGADLYPSLRERERDFEPAFAPLTRRLFRAFGLWPTCSDEHIGEYLAYGWEGGERGHDFAADERFRLGLDELIDAVLAGSRPPPPDWTEPSGERGVAAMAAMLRNQRRFLESGVVRNGGVIPNLPEAAAVEVPVVVDAAGVHPVSLGPLPDGIAALLAIQANVQLLAVEAAVHASKELALQALLVDPVVNSAEAALRILDELWDANRPYIRNCLDPVSRGGA